MINSNWWWLNRGWRRWNNPSIVQERSSFRLRTLSSVVSGNVTIAALVLRCRLALGLDSNLFGRPSFPWYYWWWMNREASGGKNILQIPQRSEPNAGQALVTRNEVWRASRLGHAVIVTWVNFGHGFHLVHARHCLS